MTEAKPIIIALDVEAPGDAWRLIERVGDGADFYKVGMELYAAAGMAFVHELLGRRKRVFLDLKLYDIGETVKRATRQIVKAGITFLTVHGSPAIIRAAVEGRGDAATQLLAVTVLTSFDQQDLADLGYTTPLSELVALHVSKAVASGADGVVCSPLEIANVRRVAGPKLKVVTPGVRSRGAAIGDQKRVATPAEAIRNGADYLVIGRQVTRAADPRAAYGQILQEIAEAAVAS